jgi:CheY-like chemotaxis protein
MSAHALLIENDRDSIEVLRRVLQLEGVNCTCYERGADIDPEVLNSFDVIFLDLDLPGMDGYEIYKILRHEYQIQAPIVAYTVNTNEKATTRSMGFNGMISKPLDASCFSDQLQRILSGHFVWEDC